MVRKEVLTIVKSFIKSIPGGMGVGEMSDLSFFEKFKIPNHHERRSCYDEAGSRTGVPKNKNSGQVSSSSRKNNHTLSNNAVTIQILIRDHCNVMKASFWGLFRT